MEKKFICECGKIFDNGQSFNGHKSHCRVHLGEKRYEQNLALTRNAQKLATQANAEKKSKQKEINLHKWILEKHKCERCGKIMVEKYGSGRFCSKQCAHSRIHTEESKQKTRDSVLKNRIKNGYIVPEIKYCKNCGSKLTSRNKTGYCIHCLRSAPEFKRTWAEAAKKGEETKRKNHTHVGWQTRNIVSYPEEFWTKVLNNNQIPFEFNKPVRQANGKSNYFLDFYIEKDGRKIDLEIDGKQHKYTERIISDTKRDKYLSSQGYEVYRVEWNEINSDIGSKRMKDKIDTFLSFYDKQN